MRKILTTVLGLAVLGTLVVFHDIAHLAPGDTYFCSKSGGYWVWSVLRGQTVPTWVDP